jgi:hypothetical protein
MTLYNKLDRKYTYTLTVKSKLLGLGWGGEMAAHQRRVECILGRPTQRKDTASGFTSGTQDAAA